MANRENELPANRQPRNSLESYQQASRHQGLMADPEVKRQWKEYSRSVKGMERMSMKAWLDTNYPKGAKGYRKNG